MKRHPIVSIVTPSYNQGRFLEETIQSVLRQDYPNIEYIIIDGGSTDNSREMIQKYSDRLAYWVSEPDKGQTHALCKGFAKAKGEFMGWLCSDDILEPSMVSLSVAFLTQSPSTGLTFGDRIRIDAKGNMLGAQRYPSFQNWHLRWGLTLPSETVLFSRTAYDRAGGLDESLHQAMDYDLWCRLSRVTSFRHIPAYLGRFRTYMGNKSAEFSRQLQGASVKSNLLSEFDRVHFKYFKKRSSVAQMRFGNYLRQFVGILERRGRAYQNDIKRISSIQQP